MQTTDVLGQLAEVGDVATIPAGVTFVHSGERVRYAAVLLEGMVEEVIGGTMTVVDSPGALLAAETALVERPAISTLRAVTRCALLLVPIDQLGDRIDDAVGEWLLEHLDARVAGARAAILARRPRTLPA